MSELPKIVRCAIYTRKSTEDERFLDERLELLPSLNRRLYPCAISGLKIRFDFPETVT